MKTCNKIGCTNIIPGWIIINNQQKNLQHRKFCLTCSPFGNRNTRNLNITNIPKSSYENVKNFRKRKKQKAIDYKGGCCQICGYNKCNEALSFHHLDPTKKEFTIAESTSWGFDKIKSELDKCILLCNNCHTEVHHGFASVKN